MLIFKIPDMVDYTADFICDSQATIDAIPINPKTGQPSIPHDLCSIGGKAEADALLLARQQQLLTQQAGLFTVNLQTIVAEGVVWTVIDLNAEPANTDRIYFVLSPVTGAYAEATGLDNAKALYLQTQQEYLVFVGMDKYITLNSWD